MKQIQFQFQNPEDLNAQLRRIQQWYKTDLYSAALFHVFTETLDAGEISRVCQMIDEALPGALVAGCSTNGNIVNGAYAGGGFAASCVLFEYPTTRVEVLQYPLSLETQGAVAEQLLEEVEKRPWVKAVEMMATVRGMSMTALTEGLSSMGEGVQIFGGGALSNNLDSNKACLFSNKGGYLEKGVVFVLYGGDDLHLYSSLVTGWKPLGAYLTVTAAEGPVLKELNDRPAFETYNKYLHILNDENFFSNTREFPIFYHDHGIDILRAPVRSYEDGSLVMTSDIHVNTKVRLAYGDPWTILDSVRVEGKKLLDFSPENIFVFSCAGRRSFWGNREISTETEPYQIAAPTFGFYTSGEFLRTGKYVNQHNVTQVIVAMREGEAKEHPPQGSSGLPVHEGRVSMISRMAAFIKATTEELEEANRKLSELAVIDALTHVGNKNAYFEKMQQLEEQIAEGTAHFAVAVFDLNGLKNINDQFGHACGDKAISKAADALKAIFGKENLYRIGGDEFIAVLPECMIPDLEALFDRLDQAIQYENDHMIDRKGVLGLSKGAAVYTPGVDTSYITVFRRADEAMYRDKAEYYRSHDRRKH